MDVFKKLGQAVAVALCAVLLGACTSNAGKAEGDVSASPASSASASPSASASGAVEPTADGIDLADVAGFEDDDDYDADWQSAAVGIALTGAGAAVEGAGATVDGAVVTIEAAGTYAASGTLDDGQIVVNVPDDGVVRLVLNGAKLHSSTSAPIYVQEAGKLILTLAEGTDNVVSDGTDYEYADASADEPDAAIFSHDDLTINGPGKLTVQGNYNNAIASKDKLTITGGTIAIESVDDGLIGRDLVAVREVDMNVRAGGDGIKTTNDTDADAGFVAIAGGTFRIEAGSDGIQAASSLLVGGGAFAIVSGGGSEAGESADGASSQKGLKAAADIRVAGGAFDIDAADDAVHSNGSIAITGGEFAIASGDDGIHADAALEIAGGTIDIADSYEGIEGAEIAVSNGSVRIVASDDGVNVAGGNDESATGGRRGPDAFAASAGGKLTISGGYLYVDTQGDGLDANGSIAMSGGTAIVNGPTDNGNGALDYDGTFELTGGLLIAAGSAGMAQGPSEQSTQAGILMTYPQTQAAGTLVRLEDGDGNAIVTFAPAKSYQSVFVSTPDLRQGAAYTLYTGGASTGAATDGLYADGTYEGGTKVVAFETASVVTWVNESGVTEAGSGRPGGFGGGGKPGMEGPGQGGQGGGRMRPDGGGQPQ